MLQLVYHAPSYIRRLAASLLPSFKSAQVRSQLSEIVLDAYQDAWIRIYALRAYTAVPGDHVADQFQPLAQQALLAREEHLNAPAGYRNYLSVTQPDLLDSLSTLADDHPSNRSWFFDLIREAHPLIAVRFLKSSLNYSHSDEFRARTIDLLLGILNEHPDYVDLTTVSALSQEDSAEIWEWLEQRFDAILEMSLANPEDRHLEHIVRRWSRLDETLQVHFDHWKPSDVMLSNQPGRGTDENATDYQESPAYQYLMTLLEKAKSADSEAYQQLLVIGQRWQGKVPLRAVATHFVGQLREVFNVYPFLVQQVLYADVDWDMNSFDSPIRFEAGEALLTYPTPETWEVFVDSAFIQPRDDFKSIQHDWIAYLTDVLSGENVEYKSRRFKSEADRPWFRALAEMSEEQLQQEIGST